MAEVPRAKNGVPGDVQYPWEAGAEGGGGTSRGRPRANEVPKLVQFRDAVESLMGCEAREASDASSLHARAQKMAARLNCKLTFLDLVSSTGDPADMVHAAARYMSSVSSGKEPRNSKLEEKYRRSAGKRMKAQEKNIAGDGKISSRKQFSVYHQQGWVELFVIDDERSVAVELQVRVWQILDLARRTEKTSGEQETMEDDAVNEAPASPPAAADGTTGQVTLSKIIEPDMRKAVPKKTNDNIPEGISQSFEEQERAIRPLPSSDADDLLNNGSQRWLGTSGTTGSDAEASEGEGSRTIDARSDIDGSFADGAQTLQKDGKRRRVPSNPNSISHQRSHPFRQSRSIPWESSTSETSSLRDPRLIPSSHIGPVSGKRVIPAAPASIEAAAAAAATPSRASASPHSSKGPLLHHPSDTTSSTAITRNMTRTPTLANLQPDRLPQSTQAQQKQAQGQESSTSGAAGFSARRNCSVQTNPKRDDPSRPPPPAVRIGRSEGRPVSDILANAEIISTLFKNLRDDERVEAKVTMSRDLFERATRRLESNKSWSVLEDIWVRKHVHIYSAPGQTDAFVHASIFECVFDFRGSAADAMQYFHPKFDASLPDGPSVTFRRVREWAVDGPRYFSTEGYHWVQRVFTKRFCHEGENSSFVFRLVATNEGRDWENLYRSKTSFAVYVETNSAAKARRNPVRSARSLVDKVLDMIYGSRERRALVIREVPTPARHESESTTSEQ